MPGVTSQIPLPRTDFRETIFRESHTALDAYTRGAFQKLVSAITRERRYTVIRGVPCILETDRKRLDGLLRASTPLSKSERKMRRGAYTVALNLTLAATDLDSRLRALKKSLGSSACGAA